MVAVAEQSKNPCSGGHANENSRGFRLITSIISGLLQLHVRDLDLRESVMQITTITKGHFSQKNSQSRVSVQRGLAGK